jgi:hypothetical protein
VANVPAPDPLPWRYSEDSYYQKGAFSIRFHVEPLQEDQEADEDARFRALQGLLYALRDELHLKISAYIDVWDPEDPEEPKSEPGSDDDTKIPNRYVNAELAIYNKLGVTNISKLKRFMQDHMRGDMTPRITLVDPKTKIKFRCTDFTIRYLFHEFTANKRPDDWDRLHELLKQEDRGYSRLMDAPSTATPSAWISDTPEELLPQVEAHYRRSITMANQNALLNTIRRLVRRIEQHQMRNADVTTELADDLAYCVAALDDLLSSGAPLPQEWDVPVKRTADVDGWNMEREEFIRTSRPFTHLIPAYDRGRVRRLISRHRNRQ